MKNTIAIKFLIHFLLKIIQHLSFLCRSMPCVVHCEKMSSVLNDIVWAWQNIVFDLIMNRFSNFCPLRICFRSLFDMGGGPLHVLVSYDYCARWVLQLPGPICLWVFPHSFVAWFIFLAHASASPLGWLISPTCSFQLYQNSIVCKNYRTREREIRVLEFFDVLERSANINLIQSSR